MRACENDEEREFTENFFDTLTSEINIGGQIKISNSEENSSLFPYSISGLSALKQRDTNENFVLKGKHIFFESKKDAFSNRLMIIVSQTKVLPITF